VLSDNERKTLRVLYNVLTKRSRTPSVRELSVKTGRNRADVLRALGGLARERYIEWTPARPDLIEVLEGWERLE
jgi:DNA-binding transcriptional MocR family regulator